MPLCLCLFKDGNEEPLTIPSYEEYVKLRDDYESKYKKMFEYTMTELDKFKEYLMKEFICKLKKGKRPTRFEWYINKVPVEYTNTAFMKDSNQYLTNLVKEFEEMYLTPNGYNFNVEITSSYSLYTLTLCYTVVYTDRN
jgi:hypothetical protein